MKASRGAAGLLLIAVALATAGCTAMRKAEAQRDEPMLADAGFRALPADTPEREQLLRRLAPDRVTEVLRGEHTFYVFPDPDGCHCLYVGSSEEHDEYQKLLFQAGHPQQAPLPWNDGESAGIGWAVYGDWPWWD
jgi:hypothetical protein